MVRRLPVFVAIAALALSAACGEVAKNDQPDASGNTPADARPGSDGSTTTPDAPPSTDCTPNATTCENGELVTCDAQGNVASREECSLGCHDTEVRCNEVEPSNGLGAHLAPAAAASDVVLSDGAVINTTDGTVTNGNGSGLSVSSAFEDESRPVGIFVLRVKSFTAGDVTVRGSRALAIVSDGDVVINGVLSVSAELHQNGPGALPGSTCNGGQGALNEGWSGGGGGGFGTAGGAGG